MWAFACHMFRNTHFDCHHHAGGGLQEEVIRPRGGLPPLLQAAGERPAEPLQYLGSSFGLTQPLLNFWRRAGYQPLYLRQTASDVTGAAASFRPDAVHCVRICCRCGLSCHMLATAGRLRV